MHMTAMYMLMATVATTEISITPPQSNHVIWIANVKLELVRHSAVSQSKRATGTYLLIPSQKVKKYKRFAKNTV